MDNFFALFRRYLTDKAKGTTLQWDRINPPNPKQVVDYTSIAGNNESTSNLSKLAVLKLNGGLGTSMGCVGPKSIIEVREGKSFWIFLFARLSISIVNMMSMSLSFS